MNTLQETTKTQRISITVPARILELLKHHISERNVSRFFTEAVVEKITREERAAALQILLNASPTHAHIGDAVEYLKATRKDDAKRDKRLGI